MSFFCDGVSSLSSQPTLTDYDVWSSLYSVFGARLVQASHSGWNEAHAGPTG